VIEHSHVRAHRLEPLFIGRGGGRILVVPVPPLVGFGLWVTLRGVFPGLLASERRGVKVAPDAAQGLIASAVDEVGAEDLVLPITEKHVGSVPPVHSEVEVEAVRDLGVGPLCRAGARC
jgi:hypothetical protein